MVQQLTLILDESPVAKDFRSAYQRLIARPCTWKEIYSAAKLIEVQIPKLNSLDQYSHLGITPNEFWSSIEPIRDEYIIATKIVWWQRLVIKSDFPETWLKKDDLMNNRFFVILIFFGLTPKENTLTLSKEN